jgi:hypothetical protein
MELKHELFSAVIYLLQTFFLILTHALWLRLSRNRETFSREAKGQNKSYCLLYNIII